ncbi:tubby-related 4 isoform X1, partial [Brachionus plicatilis]
TNLDDIRSKGDDSIIKIDSNIQSLSWMSKVNILSAESPDQSQFNQEGWLATGNGNFMVGCTHTSTDHSTNLSPCRANFNLRGHKSDIKLVRWNEVYQKLASCDTKGMIYVWVKYEGRWSIELINDRGNQVTDFAWSHDGRQAAICYQDGFVLVGSVNGQRYWSNLYDLSSASINTATWTPNDAFILLGLSNGTLVLIDENGNIVNRFALGAHSITNLAYNCPKFFLKEVHEINKSSGGGGSSGEQAQRSVTRQRLSSSNFSAPSQNQAIPNIRLKSKINNSNFLIAVLFETNVIHLIKSYDLYFDPVVIETRLDAVRMEWSSCGRILCVGGHVTESLARRKGAKKTRNFVRFYSLQGALMFEVELPTCHQNNGKKSLIDKLELKQKKTSEQTNLWHNRELKYLSALTWAHNDQRLFVSCSNQLHIMRVFKKIPSLCLLAENRLKSLINESDQVGVFGLPPILQQELVHNFLSTLKMKCPNQHQLRKFVCSCVPNSERLHCTLKRINIKNNRDYYILYLEFIGGLIPLLSAKKISKIKPDFVIYEPSFTLNKNKSSWNSKNLNFSKKIPISKTFTETIENIEFVDEIRKRDDTTSMARSVSSLASLSLSDLSSTSTLDNLSHTSSTESVFIDEISQLKKLKKKLRQKNKTIEKFQKKTRFNTNRFSHKVKDNSLDMNTRTNFDYFVAKKNKRQKSKQSNTRHNHLVQVVSNFWGTKFKFYGQKYLPDEIGEIMYKTSLFHLQPRQMTITLEDLTDTIPHTEGEKMPQVANNAKKVNHSLNSSCCSLDNSIECDDFAFNLPVLQLTSPDSTQIYSDSNKEEMNCLITSDTFHDLNDTQALIDNKVNRINSDYLIKMIRDNLKIGAKTGSQKAEKKAESKKRKFTLYNKPPIWNEASQVYQLDFGGRVTQESAKNFQVEYQGKQVMQFGRIDTNAYTLDFEWPFSTVQAFSIALANITQRLK